MDRGSGYWWVWLTQLLPSFYNNVILRRLSFFGSCHDDTLDSAWSQRNAQEISDNLNGTHVNRREEPVCGGGGSINIGDIYSPSPLSPPSIVPAD